MLFTIHHRTRYHYSQPVTLGPQSLRFHPRDDGSQRVIEHRLEVDPAPRGWNEHIDLNGNRVTQVWFEGETDHLEINLSCRVETLRHNAYDFILAPEAVTLPIDHSHDDNCARAYLARIGAEEVVTGFADDLAGQAKGDTLVFLDLLSRRLFADCRHVLRETGSPQSPAQTLQSHHGACRDFAVLFVDCCRSQGIAARFASGYQRGKLNAERRHLHAWPEVYLPGAGWRGYDPTHGEAIADTHVTIAAAAHPRDTMPVTGSFAGDEVKSHLEYKVAIEVSDA